MSAIEKVSGLSIESAHDDLAEAIVAVHFLKQSAKEIDAQLKFKMIEWIQKHGEITIGPIRYYLGTPKKYKIHSIQEALEILMDLASGDVALFSSWFASSPLKHGAIRKAMEESGCADKFELVFEVTEDTTLEEGKPKKVKKLMSSNDDFI